LKRIILVCAAGMSTTLLVNEMNLAAKKNTIDVEILALPANKLSDYTKKIDVLLLGPQIEFMLDKLKEKYEKKEIKIAAIDSMAYGLMDGEAVLKQALTMI
jgi:cellobiose PTS system EIIB component